MNCGKSGKNNDSYDLRAVHTCNFTIYTLPPTHPTANVNTICHKAILQCNAHPLGVAIFIPNNIHHGTDGSPTENGNESVF